MISPLCHPLKPQNWNMATDIEGTGINFDLVEACSGCKTVASRSGERYDAAIRGKFRASLEGEARNIAAR